MTTTPTAGVPGASDDLPDDVIPVMTDPVQNLFQTAGDHVGQAIRQLDVFQVVRPRVRDQRLEDLHHHMGEVIRLLSGLRDDVLTTEGGGQRTGPYHHIQQVSHRTVPENDKES